MEAAGSNQKRPPSEVLTELLAGNRRFVRGDLRHDRPRPRVGTDRLPHTAIVTCMDGRIPVEVVFDQDVGALCAVRSGGHVLDQAALGSVELAVTALGVDAVLVMGHSRCAAVERAIRTERAGEPAGGAASYVIAQIAPAVHDAGDGASVRDVVQAHVRRTVATLRKSVQLPHDDPAAVAGAIYDLDTGRVTLLD